MAWEVTNSACWGPEMEERGPGRDPCPFLHCFIFCTAGKAAAVTFVSKLHKTQ